ncbi:hypothetical protein [uncultured Lutibacter sp.]|uniref:hypothetical protein n=1 Tax=uncultured Lutibacter sp. TaxID=437739 RepID=UPI002602E1D1|nr:hypothetical protein [uncultured Lutibacter sp.]
MKKVIYYILIILLTISCKDNYDLAEEYYSLKKYDLARMELSKMGNSDYKKKEALIRKIDSSILESAIKVYYEKYIDSSMNLLNKIDSNSSMINEKKDFLRKIDSINDNSNYKLALNLFSKGYLNKSFALLTKLEPSSHLDSVKNELLEKIEKKKIENKSKELLISKAAISSIFGKPTSIMKVDYFEPGVYKVQYKSAGKIYKYKIRFDGTFIIWGAEPGGWRNDKLYYTETKDAYYIYEQFSDGSTRKDKFNKRLLR